MNTLQPGQSIKRGGKLTSANGKYTLHFQDDGNLVLLDGSKPVWASRTEGSDAEELKMDLDGNLTLLDGRKKLWESDTKGERGAYLTLQDDRNLVVYTDKKKPVWASNTVDKSAAKSDPKKPDAAKKPEAGRQQAEPQKQPEATPAPAPAPAPAPEPPAPAPQPAQAPEPAPAPAPAPPAPAPEPAPAPAPAPQPQQYTVQRGDSLWKIAERYYGNGAEYMKIARANNIANPDHIEPGWTLTIP